MKNIFALCLLVLNFFHTNAQQLEWTINPIPASEVVNLTTDGEGNLYACGNFRIGESSSPWSTMGVFIQKYDPAGILIWKDTVQSSGITALSLSFYDNELYLSGGCYGGNDQTMNFGDFSLFKPSSSYRSTYLVKYNLSGNVIWADIQLNFEGTKSRILNDIVYLLGRPTNYPAGSCTKPTIKKFNLNGTLLSSTCLTAGYPVVDLCVGNDNSIFVLTGDITGSPYKLKKYDSAGNQMWSTYAGIFPYSLSSDTLLNCYISGYGSSAGKVMKVDSNGVILGTYLPPNQNCSRKTFFYGPDMYVAGIQNTAPSGTTLVKYHNDTLDYNMYLGNYIPVDIVRSGTDVYVGGYIDGESTTAVLIKISEAPLAGIAEKQSESSYSIYPNPSGSVFTLSYKLNEKQDLQLIIIDNKGQHIYSEKITAQPGQFTKEIDLSSYAKGIYTIEIIQGNNRQVKKVVVN